MSPFVLTLMGISSFGYIGGKLARKPGPVIDQIGARADASTYKLASASGQG